MEGLTPGKNYSLQIVPCNNDTEGDPYEIKNCVTLPGAVKNISITPEYNNYKYNLIVNWEAPSGDYNYCKIECYKGSYDSDSWVLQNTKTKTVYKSSGTTSCTLENLDEFSRYKIVITTFNTIKIYNTSTLYTNASFTKTAAEKKAWTCPKPLTLTKTVDDNGLNLKFNHSTSGAPYNISEAKLHVCYGATEEQALLGNNKYVLQISSKSYLINSNTAATIVNQIGTPSCYFVIKTVLPADYDGAVFYSNVINSSLPPKTVTNPNVVSSDKVNEWYVTSQSATLKWKNPAVCDNIKVYIKTSSETIPIETIPKSSGIEQYTVDLSAFDSTYLYSGGYYRFFVRAEYDGLESDDVDFKVTPEFEAKNLNLSYTIQPQEDGDGYLLTLNWKKPSTYSYYSTNMAFSFQRYEISYTQDYNTTNYIGEKVTVDKNSGDISGGLEPTQNYNLKETTSTILNPGTYIIKLKTVTTEYHSTGASKYTAKVVTTDTIVITIPED